MYAEKHMPENLQNLGREQETKVRDNIIASDIMEGVSVYDKQFRRGIDLYGGDYVREYIDAVSQHMAESIVHAYAAHDMKMYEQIGSSFAEVYQFLFPVSDFNAEKAGDGDAYALAEHDVIDEGFDIIKNYYTILNPYDDARTSTDEPTTEELRANSGWDRVKQAYEIVEEALDLPEASLFHETIVGPYSRERTEAFKHHTAAKESSDKGSPSNVESEQLMREYMKRGEISKYSRITDDFDLLDDLSELFLDAVAEHDLGDHGKHEWESNTERMSLFYGTMLSKLVTTRYDIPEAYSIHGTYRDRLSEAVS